MNIMDIISISVMIFSNVIIKKKTNKMIVNNEWKKLL